MTCTYKVTVKALEKENLYRVTWLNRDTNAEDYFETAAAEMALEEVTTLWHLPEHRLALGASCFVF
ncbi:MAG: hypothetical protein EHM45_24250 [Desulfobacteraceae bacterium]|nr:MAG: hypothetical protein EHM45_24250 [Desulfobacteraceae bacterium]